MGERKILTFPGKSASKLRVTLRNKEVRNVFD